MKYRSEGCRNAVLVGLRRLNDVVVGASSMLGGYLLGEISLSRSTLTADIYFIYVFDKWRAVSVFRRHRQGTKRICRSENCHIN